MNLQAKDNHDDDVLVVNVVQPPPPPPLHERLAAANAETGLNLCMPPPHWHPTDLVLRGHVTFVELPLPSSMTEVREEWGSGQASACIRR